MQLQPLIVAPVWSGHTHQEQTPSKNGSRKKFHNLACFLDWCEKALFGTDITQMTKERQREKKLTFLLTLVKLNFYLFVLPFSFDQTVNQSKLTANFTLIGTKFVECPLIRILLVGTKRHVTLMCCWGRFVDKTGSFKRKFLVPEDQSTLTTTPASTCYFYIALCLCNSRVQMLG